jgi:hypothetical protein
MVFISRFFPRLADRIAARRVRALFRDEIAARRGTAPALQTAAGSKAVVSGANMEEPAASRE